MDAAGGDDQAGEAVGGAGPTGGGDPGELARQVGGPVGPGEQAAGSYGERGPDVARAVVVADGDDRCPAVGGQVGEGVAADQGDRRPGGQRGGNAGGARVGREDLPAGRGLDRVAQRIGGTGVVVDDDHQREHRRNGCEGHGASSRCLECGLGGPVGRCPAGPAPGRMAGRRTGWKVLRRECA
jgi:hypothetical protein